MLLASVEERLLGRPLEQESLEEVRVSSHTELVEDPEPPRADPHLRRGFKTLRSSKKPDSDGEEPSMALLGGEA